MKAVLPISALIIAVIASATMIPLVKAQQRNQEGLSERNKRELSKMGPEDLFELNGDDSRNRGTSSRREQRGERSARPTPTPSSSQSQAPISAATQPPAAQPPAAQSPAPSVQQSPAPTPNSTVSAAAAGIDPGASQSSLGQENSSAKIDSKWAAPVLMLMALVVSGALIFTLNKLFQKIREGSSG